MKFLNSHKKTIVKKNCLIPPNLSLLVLPSAYSTYLLLPTPAYFYLPLPTPTYFYLAVSGDDDAKTEPLPLLLYLPTSTYPCLPPTYSYLAYLYLLLDC